MIIRTNVTKFRDPFILVEDGVYYAYGSGVTKDGDWENTCWTCYKNTSGSLNGKWEKTEQNLFVNPADAVKNRWSPEVYKYKGAYYMFATYYSDKTNHRGCAILKSSSPEGPFEEITDGHFTQADSDAIDATFYVDCDGQPWTIFVNEWTSTDDGIGRMSAAKLSDDLTHLISEPIELFRADAPSWAGSLVTDGCFMYTTSDGKLLMLWSNNDLSGGYCVGIAESENGKIDGKWIQQDKLLFSKSQAGEYDGGHGMIFEDTDGCRYLSVHSPNIPVDGYNESMIFVPICEKDGTIVCDFK